MSLVNIILLVLIFAFGVYEMRKASSIIKTEWFKGLSYDEKLKTTAKLKLNWKISISLLSILVCEMLIVISSFIGTKHYYDNIINISIVIVSIMIIMALIFNSKKLKKDIKK